MNQPVRICAFHEVGDIPSKKVFVYAVLGLGDYYSGGFVVLQRNEDRGVMAVL